MKDKKTTNSPNKRVKGQYPVADSFDVVEEPGIAYANSFLTAGGTTSKHLRVAGAVIDEWSQDINEQESKVPPMLYPDTLKTEYTMNSFEKIAIVEKGITKTSLEGFKQRAGLDYNQLSEILSIARATLINKKGESRFDVTLSEKLLSLADLYTFAEEMLEGKERVQRWMVRPNMALGGRQPISLLGTQYGREEVKNVIGRIAWGVYS